MTRMRVWRTTEGLSLAEVSGLSGISVSMLSKVECNKAQLSRRAKVHLARSLGVAVNELFEPPVLQDAPAPLAQAAS